MTSEPTKRTKQFIISNLITMINKNTILYFVCFLFVNVAASAQNKKWEVNAMAAFGGEWSDHHWNGYHDNVLEGFSLRAGVGINYYLNERWSIMSELEIIGDEYDEDDYDLSRSEILNNERTDKFVFLHVPVTAQYHLQLGDSKKRYMEFGLGPSLNFTVKNEKYKFYDGEWSGYEVPGSYYDQRKSELNGKDKIKTFNLGIQTSVMYHFGHFRIGFEANLGLIDMNKNYGIKTGSRRIYHFWPTFSYHF